MDGGPPPGVVVYGLALLFKKLRRRGSGADWAFSSFAFLLKSQKSSFAR
jgi:hypothetical protein